MSNKKYLIVGRSCTGKSALSKEVCRRLGLHQVKSHTTRPIRASENPDTCDHYFISSEDIPAYESDMVAYTEINGYQYFTTRMELERCDIYVIDPNGIEDLKRRAGDDFQFITIYISVPKNIAEKRAVQREDNNYDKRIRSENLQFANYEKKREWDYQLLNSGTFAEGVERLERIIKKERTKGD